MLTETTGVGYRIPVLSRDTTTDRPAIPPGSTPQSSCPSGFARQNPRFYQLIGTQKGA
jgi:hypothetical protein